MAAGNAEPGTGSTEDATSAAKRRRRSEDKDVGEAASEADGGSQGEVKGVVPVNGHSANGADGAVAPEAAFWSALEDAKDEVRFCPHRFVALCWAAQAVVSPISFRNIAKEAVRIL